MLKTPVASLMDVFLFQEKLIKKQYCNSVFQSEHGKCISVHLCVQFLTGNVVQVCDYIKTNSDCIDIVPDLWLVLVNLIDKRMEIAQGKTDRFG